MLWVLAEMMNFQISQVHKFEMFPRNCWKLEWVDSPKRTGGGF